MYQQTKGIVMNPMLHNGHKIKAFNKDINFPIADYAMTLEHYYMSVFYGNLSELCINKAQNL